MKKTIIDEVSKLQSDDLLLLDAIPQKKLINAIASYPVDPGDTVVALIDATVFGSAKNGLALGLHGIYWRNDWTTPTQCNFLSWDEVSACASSMTVIKYNLVFRPGCVINLATCTVKPEMLLVLLRRIAHARQTGAARPADEGMATGARQSPSSSSSTTPLPSISWQESGLAAVEDADDAQFENDVPVTPSAPASTPAVRQLTFDASVLPSLPYRMESLRLVGEALARYRLSDRIYRVPRIPPMVISKVVNATEGKLKSDGIMVVIDNSYLHNLSSFVAVSDQGFLLSKQSGRGLEVVAMNRIRDVDHHGTNLLINRGVFQDLDEFKEVEVATISEFLGALIGVMVELDSPSVARAAPPPTHFPVEFERLVLEAFDQAMQKLHEEAEGEKYIQQRCDLLLRALYQVMGTVGHQLNSSRVRQMAGPHLMHAHLLAFSGLCGLASGQVLSIYANEDNKLFYLSVCCAAMEALHEHGIRSEQALFQPFQTYFDFLRRASELEDASGLLDAMGVTASSPLCDMDALRVVEAALPSAALMLRKYF